MTASLEQAAEKLLGEERFGRCCEDAGGNVELAISLAKWNQEFAGLLHTQIGYIELATRNAIDVQLRKLSLNESGTENWTEVGHVPTLVHLLISGVIGQARSRAAADAIVRQSGNSHRSDNAVIHADVLSQLMWGTWVKLIGQSDASERTFVQQDLWRICLRFAFSNGPGGETGRIKLANQLLYLRSVRNSEAHFDNLYSVARGINRVISTCYSVLNSIDPELKVGWLEPGLLRGKARELKDLLAHADDSETRAPLLESDSAT